MTFYKQVGSIELALERTKAYLRERRAFGAPLLANQHLQFVLAELSARHDVLKQYARTTADAVRARRGRHPVRHHRQAARLAAAARGGRRRRAVPRRHRLHGRELDLALLPRHPARLHRRRRRRGHAAHPGPAWTATRSTDAGRSRHAQVCRKTAWPPPLAISRRSRDHTRPVHDSSPPWATGECASSKQPVRRRARVLERGVEVQARRDEGRVGVHVRPRAGRPAPHVEHDERARRIDPGVVEGGRRLRRAPRCARSAAAGRAAATRPTTRCGRWSKLSQKAHGGPVLVGRAARPSVGNPSGSGTSGGSTSSCSRPSTSPTDQTMASSTGRPSWRHGDALGQHGAAGPQRRHLQVDRREGRHREVVAEEAGRAAPAGSPLPPPAAPARPRTRHTGPQISQSACTMAVKRPSPAGSTAVCSAMSPIGPGAPPSVPASSSVTTISSPRWSRWS